MIRMRVYCSQPVASQRCLSAEQSLSDVGSRFGLVTNIPLANHQRAARTNTAQTSTKMINIHARASMVVVLLLQLTKTAAFSRQRPYSNYNQNSARHNCNLKPLQAASAIADVSDGWLSPQQIKTLRKEIDDRRRRKRLAYKRLHDGELQGTYDQATLAPHDRQSWHRQQRFSTSSPKTPS